MVRLRFIYTRLPNMALQQSFVEFVGAIDKSKLAIYKIKKHVLGRRLAT